MKTFFKALVFAFALTGCATTSSRQWVKPGSTAQELARADFECQKQALLMTRAYGVDRQTRGGCLLTITTAACELTAGRTNELPRHLMA